MRQRRVGIIAHPWRAEALELAQTVEKRLHEQGVEVAFDAATAQKLGRSNIDFAPEAPPLDFIVTLGGDGTILTAARQAAPLGIPILGVHMGRFGFVAEAHPAGIEAALEKALNGEARIEERIMIQAEIWRSDTLLTSRFGLNEVMVKSGMSHLMELKTSLGGAPFATYPADGLLVATPTGSTAYALSAGGPLIVPTLQAFLLVPICPHTLNARPMVVPSDERIEIEIESSGSDMIFAVDGIDPFPLESHDRVCIHRAEYVTRLLTFEAGAFYRKVRERYLYGERLNEWGASSLQEAPPKRDET